MAVTPDGGGYWLVASDGGVFAYGDAGFHGSAGNLHLTKPVVGMAVTPDGGGYWLVASDGGVFAYGDADFHGSTGNIRLTKPMVGMAVDARTGGYWLVASDGGVFAYDAPFLGSAGNLPSGQAGRRHDGDQERHRLPAGGRRRGHLLLRDGPVLRLHRRDRARPARGGHGRVLILQAQAISERRRTVVRKAGVAADELRPLVVALHVGVAPGAEERPQPGIGATGARGRPRTRGTSRTTGLRPTVRSARGWDRRWRSPSRAPTAPRLRGRRVRTTRGRTGRSRPWRRARCRTCRPRSPRR